MKSLYETDGISFDPENPWFLKYMEFIEKLVKLSDGRFPVGEPIMRGPSDMVGALLGQAEMVFAIVDDPGRMKRLFKKVAEIFMQVIARHYGEVKSFNGAKIGFPD